MIRALIGRLRDQWDSGVEGNWERGGVAHAQPRPGHAKVFSAAAWAEQSPESLWEPLRGRKSTPRASGCPLSPAARGPATRRASESVSGVFLELRRRRSLRLLYSDVLHPQPPNAPTDHAGGPQAVPSVFRSHAIFLLSTFLQVLLSQVLGKGPHLLSAPTTQNPDPNLL